MLRVRLFGEGSVDAGDGPRLVDALPKALPLLAYLLIRRDAPIPRDQLAFALWPDDDEEAARANLRRHLFRLMRLLPDAPAATPWIISSRKSVKWNPQATYWLDIVEFERLCGNAANASEAIGLYGDGLLARVQEPWLAPERARLQALQQRNLSAAYDDAARRRDFGPAIAIASALLRLEPENEAALRRVMSARYEGGDRSGALAEFERFAATLFEELGEHPMPETTALADRIADGDSLAQRPASPPAQAPAHPSPDASGLPFVGRAAELAEIATVWECAVAGRGSIVFVTGEAGIGKSRFVDEFAQRCVRGGGSVFIGRTTPVEAQPYEVVAQALRSALPVILERTTDALWLGAIAAIVPEIVARRPGIARPAPLEDRAERARLFEGIARVISDAARARPRVVVLEDIHWASNATLEAIDDLAYRLASMPVVVVVTAREDVAPDHPFNRVRARIMRAGYGTTIALGPLDVGHIADLLRDRGDRFVEKHANELFERTEGHPLFLALALDEAHATGNLGDAIEQKLAGLSSDARAFADFAAVAGAGFELDLVRHISGWPEARAYDALDELIDRRIVRGSAAAHSGGFAFAHALFWSSIYDRMSPERRRYSHRRAARTLAETISAMPSAAHELARHYECAGEDREAAKALIRAAEYAASVGANDEALASASRARELSQDPIVSLTSLALLERLHARVGARAEQRRDLDALEALAQASDDPDLLCEAALRRAAFAQALGDRGVERASLEALEGAVTRAQRPRWHGELALLRARMEIACGDMGRAAELARAARASFEIEDDADGSLRALTLAAEIASTRGDYGGARANLARAADIAERFVEPFPLLRVLRSAAAASFVARDFASMAMATQQALALSERIGDVESEAELLSRLASIAARRFDVARARALYERARGRYATLNNPRAIAGLVLNGAMLEFAVGNLALALDQLQEAQRRFAALDDLRGTCLTCVNASLALSFLGRHDDAIANARRGIEIAQACRNPLIEAQAFSNLGAAYRRSGDFEAAYATLGVALSLRRPTTSVVDLAEDLCDLALTCLMLGRIDKALAAVVEYLPVLDELCGQSLFAQDLCFTAARALDAAGDPRAVDLVARARGILDERLASLPDEESRRRFVDFGCNPAIRAWERGRNVDGAHTIVT
jgi:predicted ATPase/DNA-binding SARP family transcriptional activator